MSKRAPVLIANRGEIAIRVARTCKALGFPSVAVYSEIDEQSEHALYCDYAVQIGGAAPKESYLNVDRLLEAARLTGARYVHPGYGFLSERSHFVKACEKAGLIFLGPTADSMDQMGDKIRARATVDELGIPRVPGSKGAISDLGEMARVAREIGYPVLLKAAAGGGGKGMRRVDAEADLQSSFEGASREALSAFGDGSMYLEKFILEPHHVEIQVFGDGKGGGVHLGERECSIQRRHQKVWEESPAPILNRYPKTRDAMFEAALKIVKHIKYRSAGTLEFIVDGRGNFYFLEMNTRLQVEHPVTEWVTGVDLVSWQILLGSGEWTLPAAPPVRTGSSVEVRLYAEDPQTFLPAPGSIGQIRLPSGPFTRVDSAFTGPGEVSMFYDPMIAKISVWGRDRAEAVGRLRVALDETAVLPPRGADFRGVGSLRTNHSFLQKLVRDETVIGGDTTTDLISRIPQLVEMGKDSVTPEMAIAAALAQMEFLTQASDESAGGALMRESTWNVTARREGISAT